MEAAPRKPVPSTFQPRRGRRRKPGTGCVSRISDHLWAGRCSPVWPDGKRRARNVYARTREECERLMARLIGQIKAELAAEKERLRREEQTARKDSGPPEAETAPGGPYFFCLWLFVWSARRARIVVPQKSKKTKAKPLFS